MRTKTQFYSIRYKDRNYLSTQIEKPFIKLHGLNGIIMKSFQTTKKVVISI